MHSALRAFCWDDKIFSSATSGLRCGPPIQCFCDARTMRHCRRLDEQISMGTATSFLKAKRLKPKNMTWGEWFQAEPVFNLNLFVFLDLVAQLPFWVFWGRAFPYLFPGNQSSKAGLLTLSRAWCKCYGACDIECKETQSNSLPNQVQRFVATIDWKEILSLGGGLSLRSHSVI